MPAMQANPFSPEQASRILGVTAEQIYTWLPAYRSGAQRCPQTPQLTLSDLVGLLALREFGDQFVLDPKPFRAGIDQLFEALNAVAVAQPLDGCIAILEPDRGFVLTGSWAQAMSRCGARFVTPLCPLLASLQDYVFA